MDDLNCYKLISCDDHLDLGYLPTDLWTSRLPARYTRRAPHVEEREGRGWWISGDTVWGPWRGIRPKGAVTPPPYLTALERGGHSDLSDLRPGNPKLRLADMDRDGVHTQLIFGPITSIIEEDQEFRDACHRAYNDWLAEFCAYAPERFLGVPMLPWSPASATAELSRLAKGGRFKQVNLALAGIQPGISDPAWEPFWSALEDSGLILSFHVTVFVVGARRDDPAAGTPAGTFSATKNFVAGFLDSFVDLFAWGILERHPGIKIVLAEAGAGWLPWVVQELDYRYWRLWEAKEYWADKGGIPLREKPSDLFKRQIYPTFQEDHVAMALIDFFGPDHLLWGSDYPHPDSVWPNSRAAIERQMGRLAPELRKKLTHDNAAKLYRLNI
ncbi:MAG TPA: amidohydrolase family protein [Candidatus Binataceae bacterium]|nr:amidohydrolase family protein [Candidatus Binataceae bacterium]